MNKGLPFLFLISVYPPSMSCCHEEEKTPEPDHCATKKGRPDFLLYGSLSVITLALILHFLPMTLPYFSDFSGAVADLLKTMWWGIVLGIVAVGMMNKVPREYFNVMLGRGDTMGGIFRAALAGLLLDLCSHGILMVAAKLYERGASLAQVMTFLIASPWNSITLTLILIALIGLPWTLLFIAGSALIAIITGFIYILLVKHGVLADNPNTGTVPDGFDMKADIKKRLKNFRPSRGFIFGVLKDGITEGRMVMRWLFFGTILAALIRTFVSTDIMMAYFGPTLAGLGLTLLATTIIEVCSEGSSPIGAELVNRAKAPGNGFAFLMAGVSTDYTEMLVIREFAKSWKIALTLPLLTVPQVLLLGWIMNHF